MINNLGSFIFGYGGLILSESRKMTLGVEISAVPAILKGFERFWGFVAPQYGLTTVALRSNEMSSCAGVIFPITQEQLVWLDVREKGYKRVELSNDQIQFLQPQESLLKGALYTYISETNGAPSLENPITQSDIDAILTGSLRDFGEAFAREIIRTTNGWDGPWINDRESPRYPWSFHNSRFTQIIDKILNEMIRCPLNKD